MQVDLDIWAHARSGWITCPVLSGIFIAIAIVLTGITLSVEYQWVKVIDVQQQAGRDIWNFRAIAGPLHGPVPEHISRYPALGDPFPFQRPAPKPLLWLNGSHQTG